MATNPREMKGKEILENGGVKRINSERYQVKSQSSDSFYTVNRSWLGVQLSRL
jgi:hypothetical protein